VTQASPREEEYFGELQEEWLALIEQNQLEIFKKFQEIYMHSKLSGACRNGIFLTGNITCGEEIFLCREEAYVL